MARLFSTSPEVAIRVTALSVSVVTPNSAARSGSGRMTISGFSRLALDVTLLEPGHRAQIALRRRGCFVQPLGIVACKRELQLAAVAHSAERQAYAWHVLQRRCGRDLEFLQRHFALVARRQRDHQAGAAHVSDGIAAWPAAAGRCADDAIDAGDYRYRRHPCANRFGDLRRLFQRSTGRQLDLKYREADIAGRREAFRNERNQRERCDQQHGGDRQRLAAMPKAPFDRDQILELDPAVFVLLRMRPQHVGRHHRCEHAGDQQREHHRDCRGESEGTEEFAGDAAHECYRHEDGAQRQRGRDDREADLDRGVGRGLERLLAIAQMPHDILDFDDRVVDEHADDQRQREQRQQVQRVAEQVHRPERRDDRQRQRRGGDERRTPVAQEYPHDDDREQRAFEQHFHRRCIRLVDEVDRRTHFLEAHVRVLLAEPLDRCARGLGHVECACAPGTHHLEAYDLFAIEQRKLAPLRRLVAHIGDRVQPQRAPIGEHDRQRGQLLRRRDGAGRAHILFEAADAGLAAGILRLDASQLPRDIACGGAERGHAIGIEVDADLARHAADALHAADAFDRGQLAHHRQVDEPRQFGVAHVRRRDAERDDGTAGRRDARDHRLARVGGQIGAYAGDGVAHLVDCFIDVALEAKHDRGRRDALVDGRVDVLDAGHRGDRVFDLARDLGFQLRRRNARIHDRDDDRGQLDVGPVLHSELGEADQPRDGQRDEQDDDGNRIADRPGDEVHEPAPASGAPSTTRTGSPSLRKPAPLSTMRSPGCTPLTISICLSRTAPVSTRRRATTCCPETTKT